MEIAERMIHSYMKNHRSVMLTVIPANVDIATQEILEKAEEVDPDRIRNFRSVDKAKLGERHQFIRREKAAAQTRLAYPPPTPVKI